MATIRATAPQRGNAYDHLRAVYSVPRPRTTADQEVADRLRDGLPARVWGYLVGAPGFVEVAPDGTVLTIARDEWPE